MVVEGAGGGANVISPNSRKLNSVLEGVCYLSHGFGLSDLFFALLFALYFYIPSFELASVHWAAFWVSEWVGSKSTHMGGMSAWR